MGTTPGSQESLRNWLRALPSGTIARYLLELGTYDQHLTGVVPAIALMRAELRHRDSDTRPRVATPEPRASGLLRRSAAQLELAAALRRHAAGALERLSSMSPRRALPEGAGRQ